MTPKEKATQLFDLYYTYCNNSIVRKDYAKQCALIMVNEILESEKLDYLFSKEEINSMEFTSDSMWVYERFSEFWQEVKEEINKL